MKKPLFAALLLALLLLGLWAGWLGWRSHQRGAQLAALAQTAADLHQLPVPLAEAPAGAVVSEHLLGGHWQLQGASHLKVLDSPGLLLRYEAAGAPMTLIQLPASHWPLLADLDLRHAPQLSYVRGLRVGLWREQNLLMLMVEARDQTPIARPKLKAPDAP